MKKDLAHVCDYYKALVISYLPDDFFVAEPFRYGLTETEIKKGIIAYREFLNKLFDKIAKNKDRIDVIRGSKYDPFGTKGDRGTSSVKECFPVFFDIAMILTTLGFYGQLEKSPNINLKINGKDMLIPICSVTEKYQSVIKMSNERKKELFCFLGDLGFLINGADFSKSIDLLTADTFYINYNKNDYFTVGLKLISDAAFNIKGHYKLENLLNPIILSGDFSPLIHAKPRKCEKNIVDIANGQLPEIKEWIININSFLLKNGCKVIQGMGGGPPFTYNKRNTTVTLGMVCILEMGLSGCFITPGVNHLVNQNNIIELLPDNMVQMLISRKESSRFNSKQCYRKNGNMGFSRFSFKYMGKEYEGCRHVGNCQYSGVKCCFNRYKFDLSDPNVRDLMMKWLELEVI